MLEEGGVGEMICVGDGILVRDFVGSVGFLVFDIRSAKI